MTLVKDDVFFLNKGKQTNLYFCFYAIDTRYACASLCDVYENNYVECTIISLLVQSFQKTESRV